MTSPPSPSRRSAVAPFLAMDVLREARELERQGRKIVHMELGEPGAPAPLAVRDAAAEALRKGVIGYAEALGQADLRERIARHYAKEYGVDVAPARIVVTTGSSGAFLLSFLAAFDPGARIAITAPGYPAYANILESLGLEPVVVEVGPQTRYAPTAALLEAAHKERRIDGALLMSPANPTGAMIAAEELARICAFCDEAGILFLSDEIYHGLAYETRCETALRFSQRAVVINSFSKYYAMTGWRLGWLVAPETLVRPIERLQQSLAISAPTLAQAAALAAFDATAELEAIKASYARSRALLVDRLPRIGFTDFAPPDGAFYIYADVSRFTGDSMAFCKRVLEEAGVATTPGVDFDRSRGARTLRFSYAGPESEIALGVERLAAWLRR
ncbi:MAG: 1-aminocyclopropane-1-carboxylate deaminase [Methylocystaceae bacterium]|nr:MAG: 1-aminocyclopropane-1-carboxylate deaminase [Methylocystaceae bacterium]